MNTKEYQKKADSGRLCDNRLWLVGSHLPNNVSQISVFG